MKKIFILLLFLFLINQNYAQKLIVFEQLENNVNLISYDFIDTTFYIDTLCYFNINTLWQTDNLAIKALMFNNQYAIYSDRVNNLCFDFEKDEKISNVFNLLNLNNLDIYSVNTDKYIFIENLPFHRRVILNTMNSIDTILNDAGGDILFQKGSGALYQTPLYWIDNKNIVIYIVANSIINGQSDTVKSNIESGVYLLNTKTENTTLLFDLVIPFPQINPRFYIDSLNRLCFTGNKQVNEPENKVENFNYFIDLAFHTFDYGYGFQVKQLENSSLFEIFYNNNKIGVFECNVFNAKASENFFAFEIIEDNSNKIFVWNKNNNHWYSIENNNKIKIAGWFTEKQ